MAPRKTILATGEIYHVFNHSVQGIPIFRGTRESDIFLEAVKYYLQPEPPFKFSIYRISKDPFNLDTGDKLATIINYCLMPNHFHFTLRQETEGGIKKFIQRLSNSFAHYFSVKYKNKGPVFEGNFKAIRVENEEQLLHLSRYIHLNPVSAYLVENPQDYSYSSYRIYLGDRQSKLAGVIDSSMVVNHFSLPQDYAEFVLDRKDYQRTLEGIKHLIFE